ncbi:MAG TPA: FGGY-family carbohydrate kinase, partial [Armatimonadota bacterium]
TLRVIGEGTNATPWLQAKADILQCPVEWVDVHDAITRGAALLAGWGADVFTDLPSACASWLPTVVRIEPHHEDAARYEQQYRRFVQLYPALRGIYNS